VLVEGASKRDARELSGRTSNNRMVNFAGCPELVGQFVPVLITESLPHSLRGERCAPAVAERAGPIAA
jgi:tRNA-2-methylthio-N6-dimethylallyladenosine synthase